MPGDCARRLSRNRMADQEFRGNESRLTPLLASCHPSRATPPGRGDSPGAGRYVRERIITATRGEEALQDLHDLPLNRYPHDILMPRVWELRAVLTAYDAVYVTLAELLDAPLVTCDRKIALACGHRAAVEVI